MEVHGFIRGSALFRPFEEEERPWERILVEMFLSSQFFSLPREKHDNFPAWVERVSAFVQ